MTPLLQGARQGPRRTKPQTDPAQLLPLSLHCYHFLLGGCPLGKVFLPPSFIPSFLGEGLELRHAWPHYLCGKGAGQEGQGRLSTCTLYPLAGHYSFWVSLVSSRGFLQNPQDPQGRETLGGRPLSLPPASSRPPAAELRS